jgi:PAS domain S-box-containing protein
VTHDQVLGRLFCKIGWLGDAAVAGVRNAIAQAAKGEVWRGDIVANFPQVGRRVVDTVFSPVLDHRGATSSVIAFGIDVTDRRLLQERLQQAQQLASVGNIDQDFTSNTTWWSDETYRLMGLQPGSCQPSYEGFLDAVHPDDRATVDAEYRRSLGEASSYDFDCRFRAPDGAVRHVHARVRTTVDSAGQPMQRQATLQDVSHFVKADMLARESELFFAAAFHDNPIGMGLRRLKDDVIVEVNGAFLAMFGLRREQVVGRTVAALNLYPDPQARARISEGAEDREPLRNVELQLRHSSGQMRDVVMTTNYITVNGEECVLCTFVDDSERHRAAVVIQNALAEKETLLREIHHRVKNNLQVVSSLLHFQSKKASTPEHHASIAAIRERLIAMTLVHEKLYQSGDLEQVEFGDYLRGLVAEVLRSRPARDNVSVDVEADGVLLPMETALPCGMILCELVTNVLKYAYPSGGPGTVSVSVRANEGDVVITVDDDGVGFPAEFDVATSESFGFTLVRALVLQIHGAIEVTSARGVHVRVSFPVQAPSENPDS